MFEEASQWFKILQDEICNTIQDIEPECKMFNPNKETPIKQGWSQEHKVIYGDVFEKGTVNFSKINGEFDPKFAKEIPGTEEHNRYSATGISVVLHPWNPHAPAMHFNTRYMKTSTKEWYGGGMDVTPRMRFDTNAYHTKIQNICDYYNPEYYPKFSKACDEYFYLPHRKETRGVGGIFFEYYDPSNMDFNFVKDVGRTFNNLIKSIITPTTDINYSEADRRTLEIKRGRYAEFNLLYDRGTRFGFQTGGDTDAILMSMPPNARWT